MINSSLYWNLDWMELFWDPITGHLSCSGILGGGKLKNKFEVINEIVLKYRHVSRKAAFGNCIWQYVCLCWRAYLR